MSQSKFEALEKKLNIATTLMEELELDDDDIIPPEKFVTAPYIPTGSNVPAIIEETTCNEVFSLETLKSDFTLIRQNILKLISTGQRILDSTSVLDPSDMKAAQLTALSQLQQSLGSNIQLLVSIYKEIAGIEQTRAKTQKQNESNNGQVPPGGMINQGSVVNNNIVFSGDTEQLLSFLKENQNT